MTAVNVTSRLPSRPVMRTFWPTAKSDAPPCTSKQLFISAPYQSAMRCGTKKTKISFAGTANSRTNSRLAIAGFIFSADRLVDFDQHERHIIGRRTVAPLSDTIEDSMLHLFEREQGSFAHNFLYTFNSQHFAVRIENIRDPIGIEHDAVPRFEVYIQGGFRSYGVGKRAQDHTARLEQAWLVSVVSDHARRMARSSK